MFPKRSGGGGGGVLALGRSSPKWITGGPKWRFPAAIYHTSLAPFLSSVAYSYEEQPAKAAFLTAEHI